MLNKQPTQVARTNTQPLGKSFNPAFFETAFAYQAQSA
jgi:hypothetical protein